MLDLKILVYAFVGVVVFFLLGTMAITGYRGAPWVPTRKKDLDRLISLAGIKDGDLIYELGSGDGRILFEIVKQYSVDARGVEISLAPYLYSKMKSWITNTIIVHKMKGRVRIKYQNLFQTNLSSADLVICFLMPKTIEKLEKKFASELKKGAKVISYVFPMKSYLPVVVSKPDESSIGIYLYQF
jgi:hypothetical protein